MNILNTSLRNEHLINLDLSTEIKYKPIKLMQLFIILFIILSIIIQVKAITDIVKKIKEDKNSQNILLAWLLIVLFSSVIGAVLYFKLQKKEELEF
jgi:hypothetical protein